MKKSFYLILILTFMIIFTSCNYNNDLSTGNKIVSPVNNSIPILGEWKVMNVKPQDISKLSTDKTWNNTIASFSTAIATLGNNYCKKPIYKTKIVDAESYLFSNYKGTPSYLDIKQKEIQIITITSENNFFYEFMKVDDNSIITNVDGMFLFLKKVSKNASASSSIASKMETTEEVDANDSSKSKKSGVLIGLRSIKKATSESSSPIDIDYSYRTLWICFRNNTLDTINQTQNIFLPRMSGFWTLESTRIKNDDYLNAFPFGTQAQTLSVPTSTYVQSKAITFAANDYISIAKTVQNSTSLESDVTFSSSLQVLPIDNLNSKAAIKITQLTSTSGGTALKESAAAYANLQNNKSSSLKDVQDDNWGVFRKNGHWILQGRLNYMSADPKGVLDFLVPIVAPKILIGYDDLSPSWSSIQEKVPDAVDAISSPNKDILITLSNTILSIYKLTNNQISPLPLAQVVLQAGGEKLIMDQWALGDYYTDSWTKSFNKNNVTPATMIKKAN